MPTAQELLTDPSYGLVKEARAPQRQMAASVEDIVRNGGVYFCEGPVGLGKTLAYLVPALAAEGKRIVVATAKKQLQDQIITKDFPAIRKALGPVEPPLVAAPLKGKANYACRLGAETILGNAPEGGATYMEFVRKSPYGDRTEYNGAPPRWWAAANAEDCIGKRCGYYDSCGYQRLKKDLSSARLVVINHHVLGAEMYFGFGKLVGGPYDVLVIDEAHTLAAGIRSAFTHRVAEDSITSLNDLLNRTAQTFPAVRRLMAPWDRMFQALPDRHFQEAHAREYPVFGVDAKEVVERLSELANALNKTAGLLDKNEEVKADDTEEAEAAIEVDVAAMMHANEEMRGKDLAVIQQAQRRVESLLKGLKTAQGIVDADPDAGDLDAQRARRDRILANTAIYAAQDERGKFGVSCAPVNVGGIASQYLTAIKSVVVCSATLAIDGQFGHVSATTGVTPKKTEVLPTSFNYAAQGFVFIPRGLPAVGRSHPEYNDVMQRRVALATRLVELSDGGAFVLTTANDELDAFATALKARFPRRTFVQGHRKNPWDGDANAALEKFRATKNAVLVGSKSFWEGVDVPGGDLRLVIMAKLPFPQFNDPIVKARERLAGDNAFNDVQLADMLIDLRQGVGRLIRTKDDRGCVAILDSRIWEKTYGGNVRRALPWPNSQVTSNFSVCEKYLPMYASHFNKAH